MDKCRLCSYAAIKKNYDKGADLWKVECPRCSTYYIANECEIPEEEKYIYSAIAREGDGKPVQFNNDNIGEYKERYFIDPNMENIDNKAQKIIDHIMTRSEHFGKKIQILLQDEYPLAYAKNSDEFIALLNMLEEAGWIECRDIDNGRAQASLTSQGWLERGSVFKKGKSGKAFIACWFDDEGSMEESIKTIKKVLIELGIVPVCLEGNHYSETIMGKAINEIRACDFMIADLTGMRHSVFYEFGRAHEQGKEVIFIYNSKNPVSDKTPLEFYARHYYCHDYGKENDLYAYLKDAISIRIINNQTTP